MNLRFVEAFHWAVALKSVTRAAEKLHLTQSALSSRIAALESELGVLLLDRRSKQFRLTGAGQRFHTLAQGLLSMQAHIKSEMGSSVVQETVLRVGAIESVVHSWLTGWLKYMQTAHPRFELELTVETSPVLADQLQRGKLDLAFTMLPATGDGVHARPMSPMPMCFVGHRELHTARRYGLETLRSLDLLTFQRGSQPHVNVLEIFRESGGAMPRVHAISSISAMAQLVEAGFGIAALPRAAVKTLAHRLPFRMLPVEFSLAPLPMYASYRDDPSSHLPEAALRSAVLHATDSDHSSKKSM